MTLLLFHANCVNRFPPPSLFSGFFQAQVNLKNLYIKNNLLKTLSTRTFDFTVSIQVLDLSNNQLMFEGASLFANDVRQSPLQRLKRLEHLNLRNNSLEHIHSDFYLIMTSLKVLDLSHNNISNVMYTDLRFPDNGIKVDFSHNNIKEINFKEFEQDSKDQNSPPKTPPELNFDDNPLVCDCHALHFVKFLQGKLNPAPGNYLNIPNKASLVCTQPGELNGTKLVSVDVLKLTCDLATSPFAEKCPDQCSCQLRPQDQAVIVNCTSLGLTTVPDLPIASEMYYNHTILHIENNHLSTLPDMKVKGYDQVREIYANSNNISKVLPQNIPDHLTTLDLSMNRISNIEDPTLTKLNNVTNVYLMGNQFGCTCEMKHMLAFLQSKNMKDRPVCVNSKKEIRDLTTGDLCPEKMEAVIIFAVVVSSMGVIGGVLAALYYKYQQKIKIWMYWHNIMPFLFNSDVLDNDKKYDAFISYSHKDEDFVTDQLMPELEQKRRFNLCIHRRDWTPGDFIPEQVSGINNCPDGMSLINSLLFPPH